MKPAGRYQTLRDVCKAFDQLSMDAQLAMQGVLYDQKFKAKDKRLHASLEARDAVSNELERSGFVIVVDNLEFALEDMMVKDIVERLAKAGCTGFKKRPRKAVVDFAMENLTPEQTSDFMDGISLLVVSPEVDPFYRKLYTYMRRKNDHDEYFDPDTGEMKKIPYGVTMSGSIGLDGTSSCLKYEWPDDEVTKILHENGHYPTV